MLESKCFTSPTAFGPSSVSPILHQGMLPFHSAEAVTATIYLHHFAYLQLQNNAKRSAF